jgi:hypothetical protein
VNWLAAYREQLAEEAAGRSDRFARILRRFRAFFLVCVGAGVAFICFGVWYMTTLPEGHTAGMAFIIFPYGALLISLVGLFPYGIAKLFLSVEVKAND